MYRILYSSALYLLSPPQFVKLWRKGQKLPAYRQRWGERLALFPAMEEKPRIWLHAVSVGETIAAAPLVKQLQQRYPHHTLLLTTTTPTGSEQVQRLFGNAVEHVYFPYDLPGTIKRFLRKTHPSLLLIMETELWPNCFHYCQQNSIPILVANARLSPKSFRGYRKFIKLVAPTLQTVYRIAAQSTLDRDRFICLGADASRVIDTGNIKFDITVDSAAKVAGKALRNTVGNHRPIWIAASTHEGEEDIILQAHQAVRQTIGNALLILVPRHPERFDAVAELCHQYGMTPKRRSQQEIPDENTAVYLGDTMGELMTLYAVADIAFVGGSFNHTGGHNPLEPCSLSLPVLTGPTIHNFTDIYRVLEVTGAAEIIQDNDKLSQHVIELLNDKNRRIKMGKKGKEIIAKHQGATEKILEMTESALNSQ